VIPPAGRIQDVSGKWLIPGLIHTHVHLFGSSGLYAHPDIYDLRASHPYETEIRRVRQRIPFTLSRYLCAGVTSVVSLGGPQWDFQVQQQALQAVLAPRVAVAGPFLSLPGPENLWTPQDPDLVPVKTPEEARAVVQQLRVHAPNLLKTGFLPSSTYTLSDYLPILEAIIAEGHAQGLRVAVHATELKAAKAAVRAGADVLAHTVFDHRVDDAFLQMVTKQDVVTLTTLGIWERLLAVLTQKVKLLDIEHSCGDPDSIASWAELATISHAHKPPIPDWVSLTPLWQTTMLANIKRLHEAGALIAVGSDSGNIGTLHGSSFHRELHLLAEAGLSPMTILIAATSHGARVLGRASELGTIEPGKLADIVILNADPLTDVHNMSNIHAVLKDGKIFEHSALIAIKP
jgi:imidazolonepropionase-like amidohydrolase